MIKKIKKCAMITSSSDSLSGSYWAFAACLRDVDMLFLVLLKSTSNILVRLTTILCSS